MRMVVLSYLTAWLKRSTPRSKLQRQAGSAEAGRGLQSQPSVCASGLCRWLGPPEEQRIASAVNKTHHRREQW
jgi:hypothetical protein